ncbi:hypothetical protein SLEP1_g25883 [Rubroshorea leprosula]|nr:hypothetical protein SLEP1_g25883 [Rubroshorea leprosula]
MKGEKWDFVYVMFAETAYVGKTSKNDTFDLWHARLGHISYLRLQVMMNKSMMKGLPKLELHKDVVCAGCQYGKAHQLPYQDSKFKAKEPLQLVHLDVFGKVKLSSIGGAHYMVTFIDDYLRNVVFDEASFWRSPQEVVLPDSKELEEEVQEKLGEDTCRLLDTQEVVEKEKEIPLERTVNPWQTGNRKTMRKLHKAFEWRKALEKEIKALMPNQTWELVPKPNDVKLVSCKWVYKVKTRLDKKIERYKARLVARGVLLALATSKSWKLWQMDVKNAFLLGKIDKEIYMEQPCGFEDNRHPEYVCKLNRVLYGLKQVLKAWYGKIVEFLVQSGYSMIVANSSLFVKTSGNKITSVLVYMDELIVIENDIEEILQTKENLSVWFQMKELGELKQFLGLEVDQTKESIFLCQQKHALDLLKKFGMLECKPISTPIEMNARLCSYKGKELASATMYWQLIESLIYLTLSRPDISFAIRVVSRFAQNPKKPHLEVVRHILKYVERTLDYGILYRSGTECKVVGFCDANYARCHDTRRSTIGCDLERSHSATRDNPLFLCQPLRQSTEQ